jgi:SAM-dependent methyltransferase
MSSCSCGSCPVNGKRSAGCCIIDKEAQKESRGGRDYSSKEYWEKRYLTEEEKGHEWYFDYETLKPLVNELVPTPCYDQSGWSVLEIGCGDKPLLPDLIQDDNFSDMESAVAIDYAPALVRQLRLEERERLVALAAEEKTSSALSSSSPALPLGVKYEQADARALGYATASFDLVLDKGTIDAMMCSEDEGFDNARRICSEAARVLKVGGCFVVVSHMAPLGHEGSAFVNESLMPALRSQPSSSGLFDVGVHFSEDSAEKGPFVYAVKKSARKATRSAKRAKTIGEDTSAEIPLRLHEY